MEGESESTPPKSRECMTHMEQLSHDDADAMKVLIRAACKSDEMLL
ncbi:hypothetical protein AFE_1746 [Acidithiobacillus ferrooxidans ATCC 23270]|jgi:hypothetical protein|uniref:Uncharacterized protein n=1 Tax=Acidithiobacillus ferrooxidans (strain ATCC 23270 / DSM 14882 / CIP 104768 / NCIMB 8455) TaxID=243159 RepID=B7JBK4_ACIF2|nr:hypothetical protein AFE_1746 [Acidithiobacillus ferrooxidans ATCC 23270]